jgi:hypothetical protein
MIVKRVEDGKRDDLGQIYDEMDEDGKEEMRVMAGRLLRVQKTVKPEVSPLPGIKGKKEEFRDEH